MEKYGKSAIGIAPSRWSALRRLALQCTPLGRARGCTRTTLKWQSAKGDPGRWRGVRRVAPRPTRAAEPGSSTDAPAMQRAAIEDPQESLD